MKRARLRKVSKKLRPLLQIYRLLKKSFLEEHPVCQFKSYLQGGAKFTLVPAPAADDPDCALWPIQCRTKSRDVHHKMARGKYLNDISTWMAVCRKHHNWIENNKRQSRSLGYILYK